MTGVQTCALPIYLRKHFTETGEALIKLAKDSQGKVAPSIAEVFAQQGDESRITRTLWPWFAVLALIFYLLDIAVRRSPLAWRWLEA